MKVLVTGATGLVGSRLCEVSAGAGHQVAALSRNATDARKRVPSLQQAFSWQGGSVPPAEAFEGVDAVISLAGESVAGRWSDARWRAIRDSRILGTRNLCQAIGQLQTKPKVLISASAVGFYGDRGDQELTEESAPGNDVLADLCQEWEQEAEVASAAGVRVVRLRIGVVLAVGGGALKAMLPPFKIGAGGPLGSGRQWWSWIHRDDLVGLILHLLESDTSGAVNATAPHPARQRDFAKELGRVLHRPAFLPAPAFALKLVLGGFAMELLSSKKVLPVVAQRAGFEFKHPDLDEALRNVLG